MIFGYARVSKREGQDTTLQLSKLQSAGCEKVIEEKASGGRWDRPELQALLKQLRKGDLVVVWKLDRLSRSLKDLLHIIDKIQIAGAGFKSLTESIDTTTAAGRMMMQMVGVFAEFERAMLRERVTAGLEAAKKKGRVGGRPTKLSKLQRGEILTMVNVGNKTAADVARIVGVHPSTIGRFLQQQQARA